MHQNEKKRLLVIDLPNILQRNYQAIYSFTYSLWIGTFLSNKILKTLNLFFVILILTHCQELAPKIRSAFSKFGNLLKYGSLWWEYWDNTTLEIVLFENWVCGLRLLFLSETQKKLRNSPFLQGRLSSEAAHYHFALWNSSHLLQYLSVLHLIVCWIFLCKVI